MQKLTKTPAWQALQQHQREIASQHMRDLFNIYPTRSETFRISAAGITLDYAKNRILNETISLLTNLAEQADLTHKIEDLFTGKNINWSEGRPALHTALRDPHTQCLEVDGQNIIPNIQDALTRMEYLYQQLQLGELCGYTQQPIEHIVNIGIGGSDLGPAMVIEALKPLQNPKLQFHFISNIDNGHIFDVLKLLDPARTLFIISSKSFSTLETLTNAKTARQWLQQALGSADAFAQHFIAVTANTEKALQFGFKTTQILPLWDWVGGRFSLWSACGLPIVLAIGMQNYRELLAGAYAMDQHFRTAPFASNMPVILALLGIWYINFFDAQTHAIIPYCQALKHLPSYLQQLEMESNGKSISYNGEAVAHQTGPVVWGNIGCNSQHTFHQLLHQGPLLTPVDFILPLTNDYPHPEQHDLLVANCLSQSYALMRGKTKAEVLNELNEELKSQNISANDIEKLAAYKTLPGNHPNNILLFDQLTPFNLGALIALYEHKTFVQGMIWDINPFDQWSVEFGKQFSLKIHADLQSTTPNFCYDSSTNYLIERFRNLKGTKNGKT